MTSSPANVPAVVVGGTLNGLGVIRSLALGRVPVYLLETTRQCAAGWSRHCRFIRSPDLQSHGLIQCLIELAKSLNCRPVLLLTDDQSVVTVSTYRNELHHFYRISLPSPEIVRVLADKSSFQYFAEREGFPIPRGLSISSASDVQQLSELVPPLIIKPADKRLVLTGAVERAVRVESIAQAQSTAARMLLLSPQVVVQEWVEGLDTEIFFTLFSCDREGRILGQFSGRKLVCSPPAIGTTGLCVAAREATDLLRAQTLRFIQRTNYRGLGSLEFKRDSRTGRFIIIEPTVGRTDWQEEIATLSGLNLPLLTYYAELDRSAHVSFERSRRLVAWRASMDVRIPPGMLCPATKVVDGFLRWQDPMPAIYYYGYERLALRVWRRAVRWHRTRLERISMED